MIADISIDQRGQPQKHPQRFELLWPSTMVNYVVQIRLLQVVSVVAFWHPSSIYFRCHVNVSVYRFECMDPMRLRLLWDSEHLN